jgi:hypothetical protein
MQLISGLVNLRALHIIQLRNDDTCVWVMRETRRFLADNVSHHPEMKLEWLSIDENDIAARLIPPSEQPKKEKKSKKAQGKQTAVVSQGVGGSDLFPVLPSLENWGDVSSDSDEDEDDLPKPRFETKENFHFYDIYGIRIFKKETCTGRL